MKDLEKYFKKIYSKIRETTIKSKHKIYSQAKITKKYTKSIILGSTDNIVQDPNNNKKKILYTYLNHINIPQMNIEYKSLITNAILEENNEINTELLQEQLEKIALQHEIYKNRCYDNKQLITKLSEKVKKQYPSCEGNAFTIVTKYVDTYNDKIKQDFNKKLNNILKKNDSPINSDAKQNWHEKTDLYKKLKKSSIGNDFLKNFNISDAKKNPDINPDINSIKDKIIHEIIGNIKGNDKAQHEKLKNLGIDMEMINDFIIRYIEAHYEFDNTNNKASNELEKSFKPMYNMLRIGAITNVVLPLLTLISHGIGLIGLPENIAALGKLLVNVGQSGMTAIKLYDIDKKIAALAGLMTVLFLMLATVMVTLLVTGALSAGFISGVTPICLSITACTIITAKIINKYSKKIIEQTEIESIYEDIKNAPNNKTEQLEINSAEIKNMNNKELTEDAVSCSWQQVLHDKKLKYIKRDKTNNIILIDPVNNKHTTCNFSKKVNMNRASSLNENTKRLSLTNIGIQFNKNKNF